MGEVGSGSPNRLFLRGNAQIPLNIRQNGSVRGESPPQAENFGVLGTSKMRFLKGKTLKKGSQIWKNPPPEPPPLLFGPIWSEGGGWLGFICPDAVSA